MNILKALLKVREEIGAIGKGDENDFHKFRFRGIDRILDKVGPALMNHGVNVTPELRDLQSRDITTSKGKREREVTVIVAYTYESEDGSQKVCVVPGEASDGGDKAVSKAMSVALRTAHIQTLQIPTGETDPDMHSSQRGMEPRERLTADIWQEARKRNWVQGDDFSQLSEDFVTWSKGTDIRNASDALLKEYRDHLKPTRRMSRSHKPKEAA